MKQAQGAQDARSKQRAHRNGQQHVKTGGYELKIELRLPQRAPLSGQYLKAASAPCRQGASRPRFPPASSSSRGRNAAGRCEGTEIQLSSGALRRNGPQPAAMSAARPRGKRGKAAERSGAVQPHFLRTAGQETGPEAASGSETPQLRPLPLLANPPL